MYPARARFLSWGGLASSLPIEGTYTKGFRLMEFIFRPANFGNLIKCHLCLRMCIGVSVCMQEHMRKNIWGSLSGTQASCTGSGMCGSGGLHCKKDFVGLDLIRV